MSKALTLRLPDVLHERLRIEAFEKRTSITALIIDALAHGRKPGTLCDYGDCWNEITNISFGGFHWCEMHRPAAIEEGKGLR